MRTRRRPSDPASPRAAVGLLRVLFPLPFLAAGLFVTWLGIGDVLDGRASTGWPTATGTVTEAFVEVHTGEDTSYSAEIRYTFEVDGREHRGDRVAFSIWDSGRAEADAIVATYPVGARVEVAYDPDDPDTSVLEPGARAGAYGLVAFGAVFIVIGAVLPVLFRRSAASVRAHLAEQR